MIDIRSGKEVTKLYEEQKSDWRAELADAPDEPQHPYIKVMPNIRYKQIEAEKELMKAAEMGNKKETT